METHNSLTELDIDNIYVPRSNFPYTYTTYWYGLHVHVLLDIHILNILVDEI